MNSLSHEHNKQCEHIDGHVDAKIYEHTKDMQEFITQRLSAYESNLMKEIIKINQNAEGIVAQMTVANGRTRALENWRWFMMGGLAILSVLVLPVIFHYLFQ